LKTNIETGLSYLSFKLSNQADCLAGQAVCVTDCVGLPRQDWRCFPSFGVLKRVGRSRRRHNSFAQLGAARLPPARRAALPTETPRGSGSVSPLPPRLTPRHVVGDHAQRAGAQRGPRRGKQAFLLAARLAPGRALLDPQYTRGPEGYQLQQQRAHTHQSLARSNRCESAHAPPRALLVSAKRNPRPCGLRPPRSAPVTQIKNSKTCAPQPSPTLKGGCTPTLPAYHGRQHRAHPTN